MIACVRHLGFSRTGNRRVTSSRFTNHSSSRLALCCCAFIILIAPAVHGQSRRNATDAPEPELSESVQPSGTELERVSTGLALVGPANQVEVQPKRAEPATKSTPEQDSPELAGAPSVLAPVVPGRGSNAWLPRTILGYSSESLELLPIPQPAPIPTSETIPLLIADAVAPELATIDVAAIARPVMGLAKPSVRAPAAFERVAVAPSVAKRRKRVADQEKPTDVEDVADSPIADSEQDEPENEAAPTEAAEEDVAEEEATERADTADEPALSDPEFSVPDPPHPDAKAKLPLANPDAITWVEPGIRITREMAALRTRLAKTLQFYRGRPLNTGDDGPWSTMHSLLGYGTATPLALGSDRGRRTNALSWMANNNPCANRQLLYVEDGFLKGREGVGFQGHPGQFLAMLAQIGVPANYPLRVQGAKYSVEDLIRTEMATCNAGRELTFTLIALSHYLQSDAEWTNSDGEPWNLDKIMAIELSQPVNGAACGGTHRIMAITYAVRMKELRQEPLEGAYPKAKKYVRDYQRYVTTLQLRDGGFSSDWFKRRSDWGDTDRQLQTTGHILEWLVFSLPRNELAGRRVVRAVDFLTNHMTRNRYHDWEVGPRGHALRALSLYQQRVFQPRSKGSVAARSTARTH